MPTTFITGSNGFVGSAILHQLLAENHNIIAAVRNPSSLSTLLSSNPEWDHTLITPVTIRDFTDPHAFEQVFQSHPSITYVIHCAAPLVGVASNIDFVEHFEKPNVLGNLGLLRAAKEFGKNVRSVVVTGSINSITTGDQEDLKKRVIDGTQWLPLGREDAIKMDNQFISYCVSKKLAEQAIWNFVETEKPQFSVTVFCPALVFGPMYQHVPSIEKINFSDGQLYAIMNSATTDSAVVPKTMFPGYIDVRDLASLHISSLTNPLAFNKRFVVSFPMKYDDLADAFRRISRVAARVGKNNGETIQTLRVDMSDVDQVFGLKWRSIDGTVLGALESFERVEVNGGKNGV